VLQIGWVFCIRTALVALGMLGLVLGAALFGTAVWLLVDSGWIDLRGTSAMTWVVLVIVGALLGLACHGR